MTNPELADKILQTLLREKTPSRYLKPSEIADELKEDVGKIEHTILEIIARHDWIIKGKGFGDNSFEVLRKYATQEDMKKWLFLGGFSGEAASLIAAKKEQDESNQLEKRYKEVAIDQGLKAMRDADEALQIARESLEASKKSTSVSEQSLLIAHSSEEIARSAKTASWWNIGVTIIAVFLAWYLGKHC